MRFWTSKATWKYQKKETIRARHILVKTEEEAKEILNKIKSGEDFSKPAMERSQDDRTRQMGGELLQCRLPHVENVPAN